MKIECKILNARISHTTCIARQAAIHYPKNNDDLKLLNCIECKKGIKLYKKAGCPAPIRTPKHITKSTIIQNHDWLSKHFSHAWV